jgi:hypothetical protein
MANIFDYITWRGDLSFTQSPFNPVDNIIFSQLAYLPLDGIAPGPDENGLITVSRAAELFNEKLQNDTSVEQAIVFKEDPALLRALGLSQRFGNCRLYGYVNVIDVEREIQFAAVCADTGDDSSCIVYRGTDLTLIGWKEDFNMCFSEVVPAQIEAVHYLEKMAQKTTGALRVGGHSKGGNLAIYAASQCSAKIQQRITDVYTNDAPGFHEKVIASDGFAEIRDRIHSFIPQESVVGLLLEHGNDHQVIKSSQAGLRQHELHSWEVTHNDMVRLDSVTQGSLFVNKTLQEWIGALDIAHREQFFEALYTILSASQAKSLPELGSLWFRNAGLMLKSLGNIDDSTRSLIRKTLAALIGTARRNIDTLLKPAGE